MKLYIGNKNYSSWSMRPWLLLRQFEIAFEEVNLRLSFDAGSPFKNELLKFAPTGKVPLLLDGELAVWDTLAIAEYLAEKFAALQLWPADVKQRARARSLCAEMHSGFSALRNSFPMNIEASLPDVGARLLREPAVAQDLARIEHMWSQQLAESGGPFLFGRFSVVDAYYAPVGTRIRTYGLAVNAAADAYVDRIIALPAFQAWRKDALAEHDFLDFDEPYRKRP